MIGSSRACLLVHASWRSGIVFVTTHLYFPMRRERSKPSFSIVDSDPLKREAGVAFPPSTFLRFWFDCWLDKRHRLYKRLDFVLEAA
jgi:hypothetical protein